MNDVLYATAWMTPTFTGSKEGGQKKFHTRAVHLYKVQEQAKRMQSVRSHASSYP